MEVLRKRYIPIERGRGIIEMNVIERRSVKADSGCLIWAGCKLPSGYGKLRVNHKDWLAHRYSYTIAKGEIPDGMVVMHSCDNPSCVNPEHLKAGTQLDNANDAKQKGRSYAGPKPWAKESARRNAKLNPEIAKTIKHLYYAERRNLKEIGNYFGVSFQHVSKILHNGCWA